MLYSPENCDLLKIFLEQTPQAIAMVDRQMRYLFASRQWLRDCGFDDRDGNPHSPDSSATQTSPLCVESILGRSHYEILPRFTATQPTTPKEPGDRDSAISLESWKEVQAICLAGGVQSWEEELISDGDRQSRVKWEVHPWKTETGEIGGLLLLRAATGRTLGNGDPLNQFTPKASSNSHRRSRSDESDLRRQSQILVELARSKTQNEGNLEAAIAEITEAAANTLAVERVGVWLYDNNQTEITCINLYERTERLHSSGSLLLTAPYPQYFQALETERAISVDHAITDPRTRDLADSYLIPLSITSKLDAPIRIGGKIVGIVCCEHRGIPRRWKLGERNFAASIADYTALALETHDRIKTQTELETANDQLQAVLDAVPGSISWFSSDLIYLGVNGYLAKTFNANPETFLGKKIGFLQGSPKFNHLVPEFFDNPAKEAQHEIEMSVRGVNRHFLVVSHKYQQGQAAVFIGFDITDRKAAEAALQKANEELETRVAERTKDLTEAIDQLQSEIRARSLLEETRDVLEFSINNAADSVFWLTPNGRFFYVNDAACITLNYSRKELLSLSVHDINPDLPAEVWPEYWEEIKEFGSVRLECHHRTKDNQSFPVEITINYFQIKGKEYNCIFARDITENKRVETELQRAKATAEAANLAKSAFFANMSHELRTPLTTIISYSDLLQEDAKELGVSNRAFFGDLQQINKAGKDLLVAIDDILDYSKIELGRMQLEVECFEVGEAIAMIMAEIEHKLITNNNTLTMGGDAEWGMICTDRHKLQQVLWHLLDNATKFTENGAIALEITREDTPDFRVLNAASKFNKPELEAAEEWIAFRVRDNGIGITPEQLQELFEPFSQIHTSDIHHTAGTGLGLAVARSLCQLMGGDLFVESNLGLGSTFTVYLPANLPGSSLNAEAIIPKLTQNFPESLPLENENQWTEGDGWVFDDE
ncbi:ATP-binding protein [Laspinema sp. D1]|uniref:histidine kinase n=1 Tax=Laspinema palackyanum D2a TaxID=2953684 RepID=A0ABT2MQK5_9CYAN|nr:ATP-binding protein [Laspinema sp. D2b]MCT7967019.1 ATP-binding protein [Laspinema sp. D2a]